MKDGLSELLQVLGAQYSRAMDRVARAWTLTATDCKADCYPCAVPSALWAVHCNIYPWICSLYRCKLMQAVCAVQPPLLLVFVLAKTLVADFLA
jgi:hypothetical protein